MSLLDRFLRREKASSRQLFQILFPETAPGMKEDEYLKAYKGWVYACVDRISDSVSQVDLKLQKKSGDEWEDATSPSDLAVMEPLDSVNPYLSRNDLFKGTQSYLDLSGNAFWLVAYNAKRPKELWQLDPTRMKVVSDSQGAISGYKYQKESGEWEKIESNEIVPFIEFSPKKMYRGVGAVEAAAIDIDVDTYAATWNRNFFHNQATPSIALTTEQNLTDDQYKRLIATWMAKHKGLINAHKPAVLEGGLSIQKISESHKELDFINYQKFLRDKILAIFGVPKPILGITEDVNRSTAKESEYIYAKYTVQPRMSFMAARLTEFYLPLWGLSPSKYRIVADEVVPQDVEEELKRWESGLKNGYLTINEVRAEKGLDAVEGGDVPYIDSMRIPLGTTPQDTDDDEDDEPEARAIKTKAADDPIGIRVDRLNKETKSGAKSVRKIFGKQRDQLVSRLNDGKKQENPNEPELSEAGLSELLFSDWDEWTAVFIATLTPLLTEMLGFGGKQAVASLDIDFDSGSERAATWIKDRGLKSASQINGNIQDEIRARITAGIEAGKGARDIAEDIKGFFDEQSEWRALRVARTEVVTAYAEGSLEGARQAGMEEKRWITAGDDRVDEHCLMNAAAGWILREVAFPSGHLAPSTHPNCRCVLEYR